MHHNGREHDVGHKALEPLRIKEEHGVHARVVAGDVVKRVNICVIIHVPHDHAADVTVVDAIGRDPVRRRLLFLSLGHKLIRFVSAMPSFPTFRLSSLNTKGY